MPDFRIIIDDAKRKQEIKSIHHILSIYEQSSFKQLLFEHIVKTTEKELVELEVNYELEWKERGEKELYKIKKLLKTNNQKITIENNYKKDSIYLDIGCGKGAMLMTMAPFFKNSIGIDVSILYILFAKKLAEELSFPNLYFLAAHNEYLPLKTESVDFITSIDVIEHLQEQEEGLKESFRVLKEREYIFLNSPNRFSLLAPEDHVRVWGVGFMPRCWMKYYVKIVSGRNYRGIRLLSYFELKKMITSHSQDIVVEGIIFNPDKENLSKREFLLKIIPFFLLVLNKYLKYFLPSYHALIKKRGLPKK